MSANNLQNATQKVAESSPELQLEPHDNSAQGQVDAVRDMVGKVQDKENAKLKMN